MLNDEASAEGGVDRNEELRPPPGMMKSNPDAGTMSLSGTMNKAISAGKALEVEAEVAAERYTYSIANTGEIEVRVPLGRAAGKRDVAVDIKETRLALGLKGEEPAVAGSLWGKIDPDESHWQLDEGGTVPVSYTHLTLPTIYSV